MGKGEKLPCEELKELKEPKEEGGEVKSEGGGKWRMAEKVWARLDESLRLVRTSSFAATLDTPKARRERE
ncbi:hypothetical protein L3X38_020046 [Prunus dulcis]|uniref:Uncharacterized protein n=1 Tax=Prunus dulcis TaxID=3755 RepID=A0AAD4WES5_PRUDU|nr:hypothetical protein L3X38_020046 [Prunus dulcis]